MESLKSRENQSLNQLSVSQLIGFILVLFQVRAFEGFGAKPAIRDVIVVFLRKPLLDKSDKKLHLENLISL